MIQEVEKSPKVALCRACYGTGKVKKVVEYPSRIDRIMAARIKSCTASTRAALLDSCKAASSFSPFISPKTSFNNFLYFPFSMYNL